jgi:hypothetical protein
VAFSCLSRVGFFAFKGGFGMNSTSTEQGRQRAYVEGLGDQLTELAREEQAINEQFNGLRTRLQEIYRRKSLLLAEYSDAKSKLEEESRHVAGRRI